MELTELITKNYTETLAYLKTLNVEIIEQDVEKEIIIARIPSYKESIQCGSPYWAISAAKIYAEKYWEQFIAAKDTQYFIWNFKTIMPDTRMFGITMSNGTIKHCNAQSCRPIKTLELESMDINLSLLK